MDEEGIAAGRGLERVLELRIRRLFKGGIEEFAHRIAGERVQLDQLASSGGRGDCQPVAKRLLWPRRRYDQDWEPIQASREILEPGERLLVQPVRIIDEQGERRVCREVRAQPVEAMERGHSVARAADRRPVAEAEQLASEPGCALEEDGTLLRRDPPQPRLEELAHSSERQPTLELGAGRREDVDPRVTRALGDGREEPGLTDPGGAEHQAENAVTERQSLEPRVDGPEFALTVAERGFGY